MPDVFGWLGVDPAPAADLDVSPRNITNHPRSTQVARMVYGLKRSVERFGRLPDAVRDPVRRLYQRANAGDPPESMSEATRLRLEELYRSSTVETAAALRAHGYDNLPAWLQEAEQPTR